MYDLDTIAVVQCGFAVFTLGYHFQIQFNGNHTVLHTQLANQLGDIGCRDAFSLPVQMNIQDLNPGFSLFLP